MTHIKTLAQKAILVGVSISCFTGAKKDKQATTQVIKDNHVDKTENNVRVWKSLMKGKQLSKVVNASQKIRITLYKLSAPWSDSHRIVKIENFTKVKLELAKQIREFNDAVAEAVANYDSMIMEDKIKLGTLYNASDYPSKASFASSFSANIIVDQVQKDDFRSDVLSVEDIEEINKQIEDRVNSYALEVNKDLITRVNEKLTHLLERLLADGKFHSSALTGTLEAINEARSLNISDDAKLNDLFNKVERSIATLSPETIRDSDKVRENAINEVKANIDNVAQAMSEFMV